MAHGWFSPNFSSWLCLRGCFLGENMPSWLPTALPRLPGGLQHRGRERENSIPVHPTSVPLITWPRADGHRCPVYPGGLCMANPPASTCKRQ